MTNKPVHELKTDPVPFQAVKDGLKRFEYRKDDRGFEVGDILVLHETNYSAALMAEGRPLGYTGRILRRRVDYIMRGNDFPGMGIPPGFCVMSIA